MALELVEHVMEEIAGHMGIVASHDEHCREDKLCRACWMERYTPRLKAAAEINRAFERRPPSLGYELDALTESQKDRLLEWVALWAVMSTEQLAFTHGDADALSILNEREYQSIIALAERKAAKVNAAKVKAAAN